MTPDFANNLVKKMERDYNIIATHFSQTRLQPWPEFEIIESLIKPGFQVLDVGCGNGRLAEFEQKIKDIQYTGLDISTKLLALAREQYPKAKFVHGSILDMPFKDAKFDIITAIASLQHIPSQQYQKQSLQEMARVAKPGAVLFMTNWNLYQDILPDYFTLAKNKFKNEWEIGDALVSWKDKYGTMQAERYYHSFSEDEMAQLLEQSGWQLREQYYMARNKRTNKAEGFNLVTKAARN